MTGTAPDHPRLRRGIRWFEGSEGLVVRSTKASFVVPSALRDVAARLLPSLDGQRGLEALVSDYCSRDALSAIALLTAFADLDLVVEGTAGTPPAIPDIDDRGTWLDASVAVIGSGLLADATRRRLTQAGARVDDAGAMLRVLILQRPDMATLDAQNRAACDTGQRWLPVFPFGDAVIVGPLIRPGHTACFRCFELRWLGISPSIALERQFLTRLRSGQAEIEIEGVDEAVPLSARIVPLLARQIGHADAPPTVWFLARDDDTMHEARLESHPRCDVCGGSFARGADHAVDTASWQETGGDLRDVAGHIGGLVDRYVGIAANVPSPQEHCVDRSPELPVIAMSRYSVPQPDLITSAQTNFAHGARDTEEAARVIAVMEAIERYCGLYPPYADVICSFADLDGTALLPTELPLFSTTQYARPGFPYRPFASDLVLGWTLGWNVSRAERILVPSAAVWYGAEDVLLAETSNGVAAHSGRGQALLNGALELIERDAFMIHWLHRISPPRFDQRRLRGDAAAMIDRVERQGYAVALADITTDLNVPAVLALAVHELGKRPALLVGAGASLDGATALRRAVRELYAAATGIRDNWALQPPLSHGEVVELRDHSRAYEHPDWLPHAAFLWTGPATTEPPSDSRNRRPETLGRLVEQLAMKGYDVIGVDITTPDVERCSVRVVRAIVPGLQPLAFGARVRLGGRRLYEAPRRMNATRAVVTEADLNPVPHCFP
jgi:ribosomal protein S12 methylthiotransferase accessory factor